MNAWPMFRQRDSAALSNSEVSRAHPLLAKLAIWPYFGILTAFWVYVALSNVLYANSMQAMLTTIRFGNVFAPWDARLLQHVLLYPLLLTCVGACRRSVCQPPCVLFLFSSPALSHSLC